ncbi:MAG: hypothetical protein WA865_15745 [Spirulinaceae cyanobacterium]
MERTIKSKLALSALSALVVTPLFLTPGAAFAETVNNKGTDANYIGGGAAAGITNGGQTGDAATLGYQVQGRYAVPNTPVSLRGAVLASDETSAIIPMVSVDVPVMKNTNVYFGAGYSFVEQDGQPTPLGNEDAAVLAVGAETQIGSHLMIYGDTKLGIDAYQNSPASAVSIQLGAGYAF